MVNYMTEVAKILGIEIGEEFEASNGYIYKLTEHGLICPNFQNNDEEDYAHVLCCLLNGTYFIKRQPWKPKYGEEYWYVNESGSVYKNTFDNCSDYMTNHMNYYKLGNCYKTFAEASSSREKWKNFYRSDNVLEV